MARLRNFEIEWATVRIRPLKIAFLIILIIGFALFYWFWLRTPDRPGLPDLFPSSQAVAHLIEAEGNVEIKTRRWLSWEPATPGAELGPGDKVRTGSHSLVKIVFSDQSEIVIEPESIAVIRDLGSSTSSSGSGSNLSIERGSGSINTQNAKKTTSISTPRIAEFQLPPGGAGNATVDTSGDTTQVSRGVGRIITREGKVVRLARQEKVIVDKADRTRVVKLPGIPYLISPPGGQVFEFPDHEDLVVELSWRDIKDVRIYQLQMSENRLFSTLTLERTALTDSSVSVRFTRTNQKKQFFWRVRSISNDKMISDWSVPNQFVVQTRPELAGKRPAGAAPPPLTVGAIHPYFPYVQVEGTTAPGVFLRLNGLIIDVRQDGTFIYMYPLQKNGWNDLVFVAEDPYGVTTTVNKKVLFQP